MDKVNEFARIVVKNIRNRKLRAYLTMLGIIIGVAALISLITLGASLNKGISEQFDKFGTRRLFVGPKAATGAFGPPSGSFGLTLEDMETIESLHFVDYANSILGEDVKIEYNNEEKTTQVYGASLHRIDDFFSEIDIQIAEGRVLQEGDSGVIMVGYRFAKEYFDKQLNVGNSVRINDKKFKVVGILEEQGDQNYDFLTRISLDDMHDLTGKDDEISAITASIEKGYDMELAVEKIEKELERKRDDENFEIINPQKIQEQTGQIIAVVQWVVSAIAAISLIVGGIGIMNSMYTAVLERTREIGVMKAVGARKEDIVQIFLIESGFLGLIGGVIGIIIGALLSYLMVTIINLAGVVQLSYDLSLQLVLFGLFFSFILGMAAGSLPAVRASALKPVDALRYE